jgi:hypothetical protein
MLDHLETATIVVQCAGSPALAGRRTMSVGRPWVRRLGLLLAAGMVVQVPGLVGVGVSGASAAPPKPSYSTALSIDGNCVATVTSTWNDAKVAGITVTVRDLSNTSASYTSSMQSVSGRSGSQSYTTTLNLTPISTPLTNHSFAAITNYYNAQNNLVAQENSNDVDAPCYLGTLGVV